MKLPPAVERAILEADRARRERDGEAVGPGRPARTPPPVATAAPARLCLEADVPVRTASEANRGGRLRDELARKAAVKAAVLAALPAPAAFPLPARVTLTRFGQRRLDGDNLARALKAVRDQVAAWLAVDDADRRVSWKYRQAPAWEPFVRIRIEHGGR